MVVLRYLKSYISLFQALAAGIIFSRSMTSRRTPQPERVELVQ